MRVCLSVVIVLEVVARLNITAMMTEHNRVAGIIFQVTRVRVIVEQAVAIWVDVIFAVDATDRVCRSVLLGALRSRT